jgi:hypothetical protein
MFQSPFLKELHPFYSYEAFYSKFGEEIHGSVDF